MSANLLAVIKKANNKGCSEWVSDNEPIRLRP